jgi:hypothetical protein
MGAWRQRLLIFLVARLEADKNTPREIGNRLKTSLRSDQHTRLLAAQGMPVNQRFHNLHFTFPGLLLRLLEI